MKRKRIPNYTIIIRYSVDDECYIAWVLELRGCMAHGDTQEEALKEAQTAVEAWLKVAKESGVRIPQPTSNKEYSGKFMLRIPPSKHRELDIEAKMEGVSLNRLIAKKL